jgi:hypothetical protein
LIKTLDSWLVHITIICSSEYNVEKLKTRLQFISLHFLYYKKFTQKYRYGNHCKSLYFFVLLKTQSKLQHPMFYWNEIKTTR